MHCFNSCSTVAIINHLKQRLYYHLYSLDILIFWHNSLIEILKTFKGSRCINILRLTTALDKGEFIKTMN